MKYIDIVKDYSDGSYKINDSFPTRNYFIDKYKLRSEIKAKEVAFLPHTSSTRKSKNKQIINVYGVLESGAKASVVLTDIPIFIDVFYNESVLQSMDNGLQDEKLGKISRSKIDEIKDNDVVSKLIEHTEEYRTTFKHNYMLLKIFNAGSQRYPKHLGVRFYFNTQNEKTETIRRIYRNPNLYITSNNMSLVNSTVAKANVMIGNWMLLTKYQCKYNGETDDRFTFKDGYRNNKFSYITKADFSFELEIKDYKVLENPPKIYPNLYISFDIETCQVGEIIGNDIIHENNKIFNISAILMKENKELKINIYYTIDEKYHTEFEVDGVVNICCRSQKQVLLAFVLVMERFQPDIMVHYNGGNFDIPLILLQSRIEGIFEELFCRSSIDYLDDISAKETKFSKWSKIATNVSVSGGKVKSDRRMKIKIDNGTEYKMHYWAPTGCLSIDVYLVMMRNHSKVVNKSMNEFLKKYKIETKIDLDYSEIWKRFKETRGLDEVFKYCIYDSLACFRLLIKSKYLELCRVLATYTKTDMYHLIYRAATSKVDQTLINKIYSNNSTMIESFERTDESYDQSHLIHHLSKGHTHNKGALVIIHKRGKIYANYKVPRTDLTIAELNERFKFEHYEENGEYYAKILMPIEADDFSSLYPSICMFMNLSNDTITTNTRELKENTEYLVVETPHINDDITMNKTIYIEKHHNDINNMGFIPATSLELKDQRNKYKKLKSDCFKNMNRIRKEIEANNPQDCSNDDYRKLIDKLCDENKEYQLNEVDCSIYDANQLVVKILMNTIYGATSYHLDILYNYIIPYLITRTGRRYLKMCNKYLRERNKVVCYNDTDSVYFHHEIEIFEDILKRYYKEEFTKPDLDRKMVLRSMKNTYTKKQLLDHYKKKGNKDKIKEIEDPNYKTFNDKLNEYYKKQSGGDFMVMVREETLYPVVFCGLKKYFGMKYEFEWRPASDISDVMFRGLQIVTRNASKFVVKFTQKIVMDILNSPDVNVYQHVINELDKVLGILNDPNQTTYSIEDFEIKQRYKGNNTKNMATNVVNTINDFKQEIINDGDEELIGLCDDPDELEYVKYIITKNVNIVDFKYRKYKDSKGNRAYYTDVVKHEKLPISDMDYIESLMSTCAQLISYRTDFEFYENDIDLKTYRKKIHNMLLKQYREKSKQLGLIRDTDNLFIKSLRKECSKMYVRIWYEDNRYQDIIRKTFIHFYDLKNVNTDVPKLLINFVHMMPRKVDNRISSTPPDKSIIVKKTAACSGVIKKIINIFNSTIRNCMYNDKLPDIDDFKIELTLDELRNIHELAIAVLKYSYVYQPFYNYRQRISRIREYIKNIDEDYIPTSCNPKLLTKEDIVNIVYTDTDISRLIDNHISYNVKYSGLDVHEYLKKNLLSLRFNIGYIIDSVDF